MVDPVCDLFGDWFECPLTARHIMDHIPTVILLGHASVGLIVEEVRDSKHNRKVNGIDLFICES